MPKNKKDPIGDLIDSVKSSAELVDDTPEVATSAVEIDESQDPESTEFVTKTELESFGNKLITSMSDLFKKQTDVHHDLMGQAPSIPSQELGQDSRGIEPVAANDLIPQAELESFMCDMLTIYIHPSQNKEENPVLVPSVNGVTQPIIRGQSSQIKRKFVEALARNRHTGYDQKIDPLNPENYEMIPCMVVKDPFTVQHDPSPKGPEWLRQLLCEA